VDAHASTGKLADRPMLHDAMPRVVRFLHCIVTATRASLVKSLGEVGLVGA
jgi:hypothetical protein